MSSRLAVTLIASGLLAASFGTASAHEERESFFPDQGTPVPVYRDIDDAAAVFVVCKDDSADRIEDIEDDDVRAFNDQLLERGCDFEHIQAAVDHIRESGPDGGGVNLYVLPGIYHEEPSRDAACNADYDGGVVEYEDGYACPTINQLVGIFGDTPGDADPDPDRDDGQEDRTCDNALCNLQLEGTGDDPLDVIVEGGFRDDGQWIDRHNGIRADRADGIYIRNITTQLVRENGFYVHETDGYVLDRVVGRAIELYGILTFASDHGVIQDCEAYYNGDSGVYPGSPADVNADNDQTERLERWAVEVTRCNSHHNALGFSGTAGNSVYFHDNDFHHNGAGYVTDSFVGGHPGMPQDHAWLTNNRIYSNNVNYYENVHDGSCDAPPRDWKILETGMVCPVFPVPVGTGVMIAGGNHNLVENNYIYDNWRQGTMLFWVPTLLREQPEDPGDFPSVLEQDQFEVSHHNYFVNNRMGFTPTGEEQPNGLDFWWDDQGLGNCWEGNVSTWSGNPPVGEDGDPTSNYPHTDRDVLTLPTCESGGSVGLVGNLAKESQLVPCATYDREDNPDPPGCDWFDSPSQPASDNDLDGAPATDETEAEAAAGADSNSGGLPATGGGVVWMLTGAGALVGAALLRRRWIVAMLASLGSRG